MTNRFNSVLVDRQGLSVAAIANDLNDASQEATFGRGGTATLSHFEENMAETNDSCISSTFRLNWP